MSIYDYKRNVINTGGTDASDVPVTIRVAHWNIGHFGGGTGNSIIASANADTVALAYKNIFNEVSPQLVGICEYNENFTSNGTEKTSDCIFSIFENSNIGPVVGSTDSDCNAIFSYGLNEPESKYTEFISGSGYYSYNTYNIKGKSVYVVECRLSSSSTIRSYQMQQLATDFSKMNYVILMGDFRCDTSEFNFFTGNGYTLTNGGYVGYKISNLSDNTSTDNIIVKGFEPLDIHVCSECTSITNDGTTTGTKLHASDHIMLYADLVML